MALFPPVEVTSCISAEQLSFLIQDGGAAQSQRLAATGASVDQGGFPSCSRQRVEITGVQRFSVILTDVLRWCLRTDGQCTDRLTPWRRPLASCCFRWRMVRIEADTHAVSRDHSGFLDVAQTLSSPTAGWRPPHLATPEELKYPARKSQKQNK